MLSIVIPAHNEESVIGKCLDHLLSGGPVDDLQIIIVCNGCSDNTANVARSYSGVIVEEISVASKIEALNRGDQLAGFYPRAYLDADILVTADALRKASVAMADNRLSAVAPRVSINTENSSLFVKAFYQVWTSLPYFSARDMIGSGLFILSEKGRSRFQEFPAVIGDDAYVRALFDKSERSTVEGCSFEIRAPVTLESLIKIKTRSRFGNIEVQKKFPSLRTTETNKPAAALLLLLRKPWLLPAIAVYYYVVARTILGSRKRLKNADYLTWERDESSRQH